VLLGVAAAFLWRGAVGAGYDAAIFTEIAYRVRAGDMPYRDVWEHKPPGIFLLDAAAQSLLPWLDPWTPVWLLSVLCAAALGVIVAAGLRATGQARLAPWCAVATTATVAAFPISYGGGQTELLAAVPASLAVVSLVLRRGRAVAFGCGILLGLAFGTSWQLAPALLVAYGVVSLRPDRVRHVLALTAGIAVVGAAMIAWLVAGGAWADAVDALIVFNLIYRDANLADPIVKVSPSAGALFLAAAGTLGAVAILRPPRATLFVASAAWVALSGALFIAEGRLGAHYLASVVTPLGILAAPGLALVAPRGSRGPAAIGRLSAQLALAVALVISALVTVVFTRSLGDVYAARANDLREVTTWLRIADCAPDLFVWGHAPDVYYASGLRPSSQYVSLPALMTEGWASAARAEAVVKELSARRPAVVIDASSWGGGLVTYPMLRPGALPPSQGRYIDTLDPIRDFVRSRYTFARDIGDWAAYSRSEGCAP
jgi:hypothetical protein